MRLRSYAIAMAVLNATMIPLTMAVTLPAVPLEPIYFEPPVIERNSEVEQLSCVGLDNTIRSMQPYRYSYKAPFYEDDANKVAAAMVMVEGLAGFAYLGYSASVEEKEQRRVLLVEQRIALLQQLKAERQCFE
jgi:hypothetical protein